MWRRLIPRIEPDPNFWTIAAILVAPTLFLLPNGVLPTVAIAVIIVALAFVFRCLRWGP